MIIRDYEESDFPYIQQLNAAEGWSGLVERGGETKGAWSRSNASCVACAGETVIGYLRGMTDTHITLYICELLISNSYRKSGVGKRLLRHVHEAYPTTRMEILASSSSQSYYEQLGFRPFYGFRKTIDE
ncbi:GNAT family N-acetyltransferase [Fictibacillus aquaticus]|uniref:GNAT family N-acetyltransferase n=1 Tax=Fictibacillus aquaticus TaxID=2021314 RepID=A0A235F4X5_9BACL|nr:GNAT family N-acetyltransferase [Fictibacillus aquaticus]